MVVRKRTKDSRSKSRTHGWGAGKKHRGAGHRGGRGFAGVGKKGGQKQTAYLAKVIIPFGRHGFRLSRREMKVEPNVLNIKDLDQKADAWVEQKLAAKEGDVYIIDLEKLGYTKLLSEGKTTKKFKVTGPVSQKAKEKLGLKDEKD